MDLKNDKIDTGANTTQRYEVLMELADCLITAGKTHEAKGHYEKAAVICPDEAGPYVGLGAAALTDGELDNAENAFKVAKRLDPSSPKAYAGLAMTAQQKNNPQAAFDFYLKSLELDSDNLNALLGLFQMACKMGSFSKVIYYLEIYLKSHPEDSSVMFSLAALYMKQGQTPQCREMIDKILAVEPDNKDALGLLSELERQN